MDLKAVIFTAVVLVFVGLACSQTLEKALSDLAEGGRKVCPYCQFCSHRYHCRYRCVRPVCALCRYGGHCTSTCTGLCQKPDPCAGVSCKANETCVEKVDGVGDCQCDQNKTCEEDQDCIEKANKGDCDFYKCFDNRRNCGSKGYLMGYGYKYCNRFGDYYNDFTPAGQTMINCVRKCLTGALLSRYRETKSAGQGCDDVQTHAFDSHVDCYYNCDFCKVWSTNKVALLKVYEFSDFGRWEAIKQVLQVGTKCGIDMVLP